MRRSSLSFLFAAAAACAADPPSLPGASTSAGSGTPTSTSTSATTADDGPTTGGGGRGSGGSTTSGVDATTTGTTGAPNECLTCVVGACNELVAACDTASCDCWAGCLGASDATTCNANCGQLPAELGQCVAIQCTDVCYPGTAGMWEACGPDGLTCAPGLHCDNVPLQCTIDCNDQTACPPGPPGGTAPVICDATGKLGTCYLDCSGNNAACPDGMSCLTFGAVDLCGW